MLGHKGAKSKNFAVVKQDVKQDVTEDSTQNKEIKKREIPTKYKGLYIMRLASGDISFFGRWRDDGKPKGVILGKESEGMTLESAYALRLTMIDRETKSKKNDPSSDKKSSARSSPQVPAKSYLTLAKVFRKYLIFKKKMNGKPLNSEDRLRTAFSANYKKIKNKRIEEITEEDVRKVRYELLSRGRAAKTIYLYISHLRTLFFFARDELKLKPQEVDWKPLIPAEKELPKTTERLSEEQVLLLMKALQEETPQVRNLFLLAIYTGMRKSELFRLKWEHIKWAQRQIRIVDPKSGDANENIKLTAGIKKILRDQQDLVEESKFKDKKLGLVFYTPEGLCWKLKSRSIQTIYDRLRKKTGIETDFRMLHGLRHHYGSTHAAAGTPIPVLRGLMRHSSMKQTERYITIKEDEMIAASEKVEKTFFNSAQEAD